MGLDLAGDGSLDLWQGSDPLTIQW